MAKQACKRFWEGSVGVAIKPQKKSNGDYFWTFSFVRAFRRNQSTDWEYARHFGQKHAEALGKLMSKAFQFMEQTDATQFIEAAMSDLTNSTQPVPDQNGVPDAESAESASLRKAA
jgi:hypothetical protein